jgi:hypothetical protein
LKFLVPLLLLGVACAHSSSQQLPQSGHGAIAVSIAPNPIVAQPAGGNLYEFPFDIAVSESGGHAVTINALTASVYAFGGMRVASEKLDAERIKALGFATHVPANGEVRVHMSPRKPVPDERLFGGVWIDVKIDAVDDTGNAVSASTKATVRR